MATRVTADNLVPCSSNEPKVCFKNPTNYTASNPPEPWPCEVNFTINIKDLIEVNNAQHSITLSMKLTLEWIEPEITTNMVKRDWFLLDFSSLKRVWSPSLYFSNALEIKKLGSVGSTDNTEMLWYRHPSILYLSQVMTGIFKCKFDHQEFPFGHYDCAIQMRLWAGGVDTVKLNSPIIYDDLEANQRIFQEMNSSATVTRYILKPFSDLS